MTGTPFGTVEVIREEMVELEKARNTLRMQLSGVENQLFVLNKVLKRLEEEKEGSSIPEPKPEPEPDPMEFLGLRSAAPEHDPEPNQTEIDQSEPGRVSLTQDEVDELVSGSKEGESI
jgi:hypothetical protein